MDQLTQADVNRVLTTIVYSALAILYLGWTGFGLYFLFIELWDHRPDAKGSWRVGLFMLSASAFILFIFWYGNLPPGSPAQ